MSDQGEKTCPLCAEEMDFTDQQLKPCKCGYEICVWCWHHIMDMAEKDDTEGRCPACRTPYNKEKIVGMATKCERLVAEVNMERKVKSNKAKSKTSEGRKQLSSVRVIQRNLVYIVGLPLNLADEDLLQHKEYFGQYGKVLKVSISRTAAGAIQHFANNTCSVYITYSKEDDAVRCIQSVHGFVLEGRSLRACFGTTKYCHAWLRSMPCTNPDCLYLHEIGLQEDSYTKDEIISAYTRAQQITSATVDMQRRSGSMLPPPADEYCNNGPAYLEKPTSQSPSNNPASMARVSPPNSSSGKSGALPAAASWGMRSSNGHSPSAVLPSSNGPSKQKSDASSNSLSFSMALASPTQNSILHTDMEKKLNGEIRRTQQKDKLEKLQPLKQYLGADHHTSVSKDKDKSTIMASNTTNTVEKNLDVSAEGKIQNLCSDILSMSIDRNQGVQPHDAERFREPLVSPSAGRSMTSNKDIRSDSIGHSAEFGIAEVEKEEDLLSSGNRFKDPVLGSNTSYEPSFSQSFCRSSDSGGNSPQQAYGSLNVNIDPLVVANGYTENHVSSSSDWDRTTENSYSFPNEEKMKHVGKFENEVSKVNRIATADMGESSIISNILSMDFDSWDEPLASPQNFAKLLGETDKRQGSLGASSAWKVQNSNQSRFSFAREEEEGVINQVLDVEPFVGNNSRALNNNRHFSQGFVSNGDFYHDKLGNYNGFSSVGVDEPDNFFGSHSHMSSNKLSGSRSQISAPPGFSVPNRAPPPGFTSHERVDQPFDTLSGNHLLDTSSIFRKPYQAPTPSVNFDTTGDIEFMDPAILAVGKGRFPGGPNSPGLDMRSNFTPQLNNFENEARLQLMMQRSLSQHQNQRYTEMGGVFSPHTDSSSYGLPSRMMEQMLTQNNISPYSQFNLPHSRNGLMSNGHWDGWNEVQNGNERPGFNKYYNGYEDSKFRMPGSGDLYNRTYGI
ncbi:hypothetical protein LguiA_021085 [Lonicera macranthoides]